MSYYTGFYVLRLSVLCDHGGFPGHVVNGAVAGGNLSATALGATFWSGNNGAQFWSGADASLFWAIPAISK